MEQSAATLTQDLGAHVGEKVTVRGWLYNKRSSGKLHFLEVRDGFGIVQCVMAKAEVGEEAFAAADKVTQESAVEVRGEVRAHPKRPGVFELSVAAFRIVNPTAGEYPITPKE